MSVENQHEQERRVVALVRRPEGLFQLLVRRVAPFEEPEPKSKWKDEVWDDRLEVILVPLLQVETGVASEEWYAIQEAWESLREVRDLDQDLIQALDTVLRGTVLDPEADRREAPALQWDPAPEPTRPTAAHPRAYKGTYTRLPKPSRPAPLDLHPFLCTYRGVDWVLRQVRERAGAEIQAPEDFRTGPPGLRRFFSWRRRGEGKASPAHWIAAYHRLGLEQDHELRSAVAYFDTASLDVGWLSILEAIPVPRRATFLTILTEAEPRRLQPDEDAFRGTLLEVEALAEGPHYRHRLWWALRALDASMEPREVVDALALAEDFYPEARLEPSSVPHGAARAVRHFMDESRSKESSDEYERTGRAIDLWSSCAEQPELPEVLEQTPWARMSTQAAHRLIVQLMFLQEHNVVAEAKARTWREVRGLLPTLVEVLLEYGPDAQEGCALLLGQPLWEESWEPRELGDALSFLARVARALVNAPLRFTLASVEPFLAFTKLDSDHRERLLSAPVESYLRLGKDCQRGNDSYLVTRGLKTLCGRSPGLVVHIFEASAGALVRTSKLLGVLSSTDRVKVLDELMASPLGVVANDLDAAVLVQLVDQHAPRNARVVPRKLREHLSQRRRLSQRQLDRQFERLRGSWSLLLCQELEEGAIGALCQQVGIQRKDLDQDFARLLHAAMLQTGADRQRRGLKRLIRAQVEGGHDYLLRHPANQRWLEEHSDLDRKRWLEGIDFTADLPGQGPVVIRTESNPLEALRFGTLTGSCLGLGGGFTFSAVTTVLDVNKQVLFARDQKGHFLARQVVAITRQGELACFSVYPLSAPKDLLRLFRSHNDELARVLGIPLVEGERADSFQGDEEIELLVSSNWWDDSVIYGTSGTEPSS